MGAFKICFFGLIFRSNMALKPFLDEMIFSSMWVAGFLHFGGLGGYLDPPFGSRLRVGGLIIKNAYLFEMQKSFSPYACAAKTLFSATTSAKRLIGVSRD